MSRTGSTPGVALPCAPRDGDLGLYLHVPFCSAICTYCNFNRGLLDEALKVRYVEALRRETLVEGDGGRVDTIYFGGGTPSLLEPSEVAALLGACREAFDVVAGAEVTLEANPETLTPRGLHDLRAAGVNRLSIGVQSFQPEELARLGRIHTADRARAAVAEARAAGFDNISLDLMMWLPGQDLATWLSNVDALVACAPDHASLYLLEIYPNAPLREDMARHGWHAAPDDVAAEMYLRGFERLEANGYRQYEISNVARDGRFAWHNVKYWTDGEWLGLGCGAHGTRRRQRTRNVSGTVDYVDRVLAGASPRAEVRTLTEDDALGEAMMMGLRLAGGVDLDLMGARHGCDVRNRYGEALAPFADAGLLLVDDGPMRLTRDGMLLANEVLAVFV
jgi:oxygen-independent coproporphyrinogen-3 oxidase